MTLTPVKYIDCVMLLVGQSKMNDNMEESKKWAENQLTEEQAIKMGEYLIAELNKTEQ